MPASAQMRFASNGNDPLKALWREFPVLAIGALVFATNIAAQHPEPSKVEKWAIRRSGLEVKVDHDALVTGPQTGFRKNFQRTTASPDTSTPDSLPEPIPISSILAIVKEEVTHKPIEEARNQTLEELKPENMWNEIGSAGEAAIGAPALPVVLLGSAGALQLFHGVRTHVYSVRIVWGQDAGVHNRHLSLSEQDADTLSARLAKLSGKPQATVRFDSSAQDQNAKVLIVSINEPVNFGDITRWGGTYRILVLTASTGEHLVYFFTEGKTMPADAMMVLPAVAVPLGQVRRWTLKLSPQAGDSRCIQEIVTDTERLQLPACTATEATH